MLKTYRRVFSVAGSYEPQLKIALLLSVIASIVQGIIFALFFPLLSALMTSPIQPQTVWILLGMMGVLVLVEGMLRWKELDFAWDTSNDVAHETRLRLGEQLRRIPLEELNRRRSGDLNVVLSGNVSEIVLWIGSLCTLIIQTIVVPITIILVTLFIDWRLAIALLVSFPFAIPIYRYFRTLMGKALRDVTAVDAEVASRVVEYTQGLPVLRATQQVGQQAQRLQEALSVQRSVQSTAQQLSNLPAIALSTLVEVGIFLVLALGTFLIVQGTLTVPTLFALLVIALRFSEPLAQLTGLLSVFDLMESGLERIEAVMNIAPLPVSPPAAHLTHSDITFEQVSFRYADQIEWTLQDVSFQLPERTLTALVGTSGSGKTTIARLISRYADVQRGTIKLGGVDVRSLTPEELLQHISVVFQDVYLFDDTIRNNIRFGRSTASDADVEAASRAANCHEFISRLPHGYETTVGEIGGALSGGERQRISIARAILKDASIVLLDEPTSALDTESEVAVQRALDQLVSNKTVVVIAHRLSTVVGADRILVLDQGQIVEQGTHAELMEKGDRYSSLWQAQQQSRQWRIAA
ncbi:ABC transporter ATP-binding protein [Myxacorys almedinensis]|uniref:ATP-binding cassette domain-containing protein n=1 Tax=Myxacorys almedinensis A TaxID=2690445 RepID=A0A8J7Z3N4_9CYAN|nr:ABC transporter ATP-binding protein [Myxacorys almedinensis]NDJ19827.1 ATP-binding cassette domain-containing protein [Myxacorys almedinensis A]